MAIKRSEYESSNDSKSKEQELELMDALRAFISRFIALCFLRFVVDRIPTLVLEECIKTIRQG